MTHAFLSSNLFLEPLVLGFGGGFAEGEILEQSAQHLLSLLVLAARPKLRSEANKLRWFGPVWFARFALL